ncbi:MAG TPA: RsmE family RNA methyltransferase [Bryobacteraceae bacterium]|nr:RsmE family RNA methyltransferase [Bryobacteraceae bacterium]
MARRRFFVDEVRDGSASLSGEDSRHLGQVLRAEPGQVCELSDNRSVYLAEIETVRKDGVRFRILEELPAEEPPPRIALFLALIKFERFEWAVEKATELGADAIVPVETARSEKGLERAAVKRMERWRRIARESSQQSRRVRLPEIGAPVTLAQALEWGRTPVLQRAWTPAPLLLRYFLDEGGGAPLLGALPEKRTAGDEVRLLVGPEGGWTDPERDCATAAGWTRVWLGPAILRAETAAVAAMAVLTGAWQHSTRST